MNFTARLINLWTGFLSLWISDVEKNHPEIAYQNALDSMVIKYEKLKNATASIIRRRQDIEARLQSDTRELQAVDTDLTAAVNTDQDDLAVVLIQKKEALTASLTELNNEMAQAVKDADSAKSSLGDVKTEINKLKAEKDRMLAKMHSAQARIKIQDQLEGLSVDAEVRALENVREHIKTQVARADLGAELKDSDLDTRLASLRKSSGSVTAQSTLATLKAARAAQQASAVKSI